ncbi:MAG: Na+/H+ antiporter NhaA [Halioglobus sp.]|jgi:Na+:H+ antiporter, NhaA family
MSLKQVEHKVRAVITPIQKFVGDESVSSGILFIATVVALVLANSVYAEQYLGLLHAPIDLRFGEIELKTDLRFLINDCLMVLFFLFLGMEIKRELLVGELRDPRISVTVLAAALGGMLAPAAIYGIFNAGVSTSRGWGIPMATDTAFALGVLMLLGDRASRALKCFVVAFAVIDDLGAIVVIAIFYTASLDYWYLAGAVVCTMVLLVCNAAGLRHIVVYLAIGFVLWLFTLGAGIHGTIAGVIVAMTVPARPQHGRAWFVRSSRNLIGRLETLHRQRRDQGILSDLDQHATVETMQDVVRSATTPLRRWERALERPVLLLILPLFALTNAGIPISYDLVDDALRSPVAWGILLGLVPGKVLGISVMTWLTIRFTQGQLGRAITMRHIVGVALLGGMGFTMSVFISGLSFSTDAQLHVAKLAILTASMLAGVCGYLWLRFLA